MLLTEPIEDMTRSLGFADLLAVQDGAADHVEKLLNTAWGSTDSRRLVVCWIRMAMLLQDQSAIDAGLTYGRRIGMEEAKLAAVSDWPTHELYDAADRASLQLAEQMVMDVTLVEAADIEALKTAVGDAATFNTVAALSVFDQCIRLRIMASALVVEVEK
ncbi:hypothetical protein D0Z08_15065 [Nocardioides immobilis]|uniref:Carboxymuconolactone decarboxylase family protein n=1 Tax=Nocardioides immobilis TaxID=2049295 RepID=A0A417Y0X7_9ACTN|nr:hypothetical protein [Nocardioides immobilis]RHW26283.1 hypothetical protein D0Z08_15065 [Nocardioides immobilis]